MSYFTSRQPVLSPTIQSIVTLLHFVSLSLLIYTEKFSQNVESNKIVNEKNVNSVKKLGHSNTFQFYINLNVWYIVSNF